MGNYRRVYQEGGCYFFTVVTYQRKKILAQPVNIERLRYAFKKVMDKRPFEMDSVVILPDHIHCIWNLPEGDADFSTRWKLIKRNFSAGIAAPVTKRGEKKVWQRRFWERMIRNEEDWRRHVDYIHYNPVKHGYAIRPSDWQYSSFSRAVERGWYSQDWGNHEPGNIKGVDWE